MLLNKNSYQLKLLGKISKTSIFKIITVKFFNDESHNVSTYFVMQYAITLFCVYARRHYKYYINNYILTTILFIAEFYSHYSNNI